MTIAARAAALCCLCLLPCRPLLAADDAAPRASASPIAFLRAHDREVTGLVGSPGDTLSAAVRQQVKQLINGVFDFEELSRLTLVRQWESLTVDERGEFVRVYSGLVEEQNFDRFVKYYREGRFTYQSEEVDGDRATVHATVPVQAEELPVTYLLHRAGGDEAWRIYDLVIDGTSTARINGRSYSRFIRRHSYAKLVEQLQSQLDELEGRS